MKKNLNKEAYYERLRHLSNIGESKKNQTKKTLGFLIDYKRGADNVAYGIVKENHQYFIKKSNNQKEPLVEDFAYIGGLENIHEYRYNKLSEADKNRNMLLLTINEALDGKNNVISENKSEKNLLSEEKTRKEKNIPGKKQDMDNDGDIDSADYMVKKDAAVEKAMEKEKNGEIDENAKEELDKAEEKLKDVKQKTDNVSDEPEPEIDIDNIDLPPEGGEEVSPEGGEEVSPEGSKEVSPEGGEEVSPEGDEEVSPEGSKEVPPEGDEEVPPEGDEENNREIQKMVGKVTNVIRKTDMEQSQIKSYLNSFISAFKDKLPDLEIGERKEIANKLIKIVPDGEGELEDVGVADDELDEAKICNECGFAKYTKDRGYDEESLMECSVDEMSNLINGYAMECDGDVPEEDLASMAILSTPEVMESLTNDYGQDELNENMKPFVEKINEDESANPETKKNKVKGMFWWETKPQEKKDTELKTLSEEDVDEGMNGKDPLSVEVQPNINEEEDDDVELEQEPETNDDDVELTPGFDAMGADVVKPESSEPTTVEVTKDSVNVTMSESEKKIRNYVRKRLEERTGKRKPSLNENKKSNKIKKLDKMIDEQFELFESILNENGNLSEIFNESRKNKKRFKKVNPNDPASIEDAFKHIFFQALKKGARARIANKLTPENKYNLMQQGIEVDGLEDPGFRVDGSKISYEPLNKPSDFGKGRSRLGT